MRSARPSPIRRLTAPAVVLLLACCVQAQPKQQHPHQPLYQSIDQLLAPFQVRTDEPVTMTLNASFAGKRGKTERAGLVFQRVSPSAFALRVDHPKARLLLVRSEKCVFLHLPDKHLLFVAEGTPPAENAFTLTNLVRDVECRSQALAGWVGTFRTAKSAMLVPLAVLAGYEIMRGPEADGLVQYSVGKGEKKVASFYVTKDAPALSRAELQLGGTSYTLDVSVDWKATLPAMPNAEKRVTVERAEFEHALLKGIARGVEILSEDFAWCPPRDMVKIGKHGKYRIKDGQRIIYLEGGPRKIGLQHGQFLCDEVRKTVEGTLYVVGLVYSVEKGRWFLSDMREAVARLEPHMPKDQIEEIRGLAEGSGVPYESLRLASYFPALFHCSGFAVSGKATIGGKLYHGRVLDYITDIGLQYNAVLFAVRKTGKIPFVNVGYAGFTGSVTGMNEKKIALGEMGGRGEGDWDGVPMAQLMRMALEDAATLEEVKAIFRKGPRTCEYYYVFSDGKDRSAVGVEAVPEFIKFLKPGEAHPRLPEVVEDCVLLSGGKRYTALCGMVKEWYGKIGPEQAIQLMGYPVAMGRSNLHSALFCPETLELWVANAGRKSPAYKERFFHYTLPELMSDEFYPVPKTAKQGKP